MTLLSWMLVCSPMRMAASSALSTAPNQMLDAAPISTSPMMEAVGATNTPAPIRGWTPCRGKITATPTATPPVSSWQAPGDPTPPLDGTHPGRHQPGSDDGSDAIGQHVPPVRRPAGNEPLVQLVGDAVERRQD